MGWIEDRINHGDRITTQVLADELGFRHVIGVHIYGRRAIAGPLAITAIMLPSDHKFELEAVAKLSLPETYHMNNALRMKASLLDLGWVDVDSIAILGMEEAIMGGLRVALANVSVFDPPSCIFIDNFKITTPPNNLRDSATPVISVKRGGTQ